ncbi:MAG: SDR family oxidoreductase [Chloroflexi bacterium]|nr:SDR family oxidoreductase [Chloroflexota bacterium]
MGILENKVAVITGSSRGFGLAIARAYLREGAAVVLSSRSIDALEQAVASLPSADGRVSVIACDVSDPAQVRALAEHALETFGRLDIWVNNAAQAGPYGPTVQIDPHRFTQVLRTNIFGTYYGSLEAIRRFLPQRSGKLINILGRGDSGPEAFQNAYTSTKAWERSFTLALAKENRGSGVGVFAYNPGLMVTEFMTKPEAVAGYETRLKALEWVLRVWGAPPEVPAEKAVWLASAATDGKTGLFVKAMNPAAMLINLLRDSLRNLIGKPAPGVMLNVSTVPPDSSVSNFIAESQRGQRV